LKDIFSQSRQLSKLKAVKLEVAQVRAAVAYIVLFDNDVAREADLDLGDLLIVNQESILRNSISAKTILDKVYLCITD
jgi:hypothetical protein